ncbi:MAG: glycosyltransferase [Bryobacterales bacterium]|nr:glycosyltransferase [Bryobacterales bacterium]MBV9396376.1 glycosyltransferase [Bryobacterales bacterium]
MRIAFFGSSLVSAYWNGAATYYRGIIRALHARGHRITFFEPDAYDRQAHRDIDDPLWAEVVVYPPNADDARRALASAKGFDVIVKASGVGVQDDLLEREVLELRTPSNMIAYWDVDAPATLDRIRLNTGDPFARLIPRFDAILTYGGGEPVIDGYMALGARKCVPIYNGLDPDTHYPVAPDARFFGDLAFLGNRLPDREKRVEDFFLKPAASLPHKHFLLGGAGWRDKSKSANIRYFDHVYTFDHNAFNCSPRAIINISRESMANYGFSPATRVFEAAGAGACIITDWWRGIEMFFEPDEEILIARNGAEVIEILAALTPRRARILGQAAYRRALADHTYRHRAQQLESVLSGATLSGTSLARAGAERR